MEELPPLPSWTLKFIDKGSFYWLAGPQNSKFHNNIFFIHLWSMQKLFRKTFIMVKTAKIKKKKQLVDFRSSLTAVK